VPTGAVKVFGVGRESIAKLPSTHCVGSVLELHVKAVPDNDIVTDFTSCWLSSPMQRRSRSPDDNMISFGGSMEMRVFNTPGGKHPILVTAITTVMAHNAALFFINSAVSFGRVLRMRELR
jgi:hypothetical protein